jgi:hypothetical protein
VANPTYLSEGGKAHHLPVFEIRARWGGSGSAGGGVDGGRERPAVVEGGGGGRSAGRKLGFRVSGWWRRRS